MENVPAALELSGFCDGGIHLSDSTVSGATNYYCKTSRHIFRRNKGDRAVKQVVHQSGCLEGPSWVL
jgi:hypothetical protein